MPDLRATAEKGGAVLVAAHGNSIRALRKHLEGISDDDITGLEIPTGIPYRMLPRRRPVRALGRLPGRPRRPPRPRPPPWPARPTSRPS